MRMLVQRLLLLLPWRRRAAERDMRDELRAIAAMADSGELGNLTIAAEDVRAQWGWPDVRAQHEPFDDDLPHFEGRSHSERHATWTTLASVCAAMPVGIARPT